MKKKLGLSLLTFASLALLAACGDVSSSKSAATGTEIGDKIKIGFNFEESGQTAAYGGAEQKAAKLAIEEINAAGGVDGKMFEVKDYDNKSETAEAANITTKLVTQDKVNVLVGPATSGATAASAPKADKAGVPLIAPSATQDDITKGHDFLYVAAFQDRFQGKILGKFANDDLKLKKVILYTDNGSDYAKGAAAAFRKSFKGEIVADETFTSGDTDFQAALTKFKGKEFDALVVPSYYTEAGKIVNQARGMGIEQPILGPDGLNGDEFVQQATAERANNIYFVSGFATKGDVSEKTKKFLEAYKAKYKEEPSMFAALAYDSVYMAAEAAKGAKTSLDISKNLSKLKDFEGVTGKMTINKDHTTEKSAYMVTMNNGQVDKVQVVEP
ncbi:ABC transporter substrate-binding protein [Streptococcus oricebi]|uniref:Branched-chain amino acid ABC transporter substrate-binding protein n=1 Tax=Streptococcus oricebi TaxID=1547447 RepID=A0ABS5B3M7_9STRE|nr:ABC transporter substrate-binding protein [Streptococcus oricebi]MBP2623360.1 branched-chain amino acid ABC transporter substrate-binding protein [Streptococcus oricebi]